MNLNLSLEYALLLFLINSAYAMEVLDGVGLKKLEGQIEPKCQKMSPLSGFTALKTGILQSLRVSSAYGPENPQFPCNEQIGRLGPDLSEEEIKLRKMQRLKYCPQDSTSMLLHMFFPSPTGILSVNNGSITDPVNKLTPKTIGKLLEKIHLTNLAPSESDIYEVILETNFQEKSPNSKDKKKYGPLVKAIIASLEETQNKYSPYPNNLVPEILTAFSLIKFPTSHDLYQLIENMGVCRDPKAPQISNQEFSKNDYLEFKNSFEFLDEDTTRNLINEKLIDFKINPEKAIFILDGMRKYEINYPPPVGTGRVTHSSLPLGSSYSDCAESSLQSFFNYILFDLKTGLFDTKILEKIVQNLGVSDFLPIINFYKKYNDPSTCYTQVARQEWNDIISNIIGPIFIGHNNHGIGKCQLDAGALNTLSVFNSLFLKDINWKQLQHFADKWNYICDILSDSSKKIEWKITREGNDKLIKGDGNNIGIEFSINCNDNIFKFYWDFTSGHNYVVNKTSPDLKNKWINFLFEEFMKEFDSDDFHSILLLPWLLRYPYQLENIQKFDNIKYLWNFDFTSLDNIFQLLEYFVKHDVSKPPLSKAILNNWLKDFHVNFYRYASIIKKYLKKYHPNDKVFEEIYKNAQKLIINYKLFNYAKTNNIEKFNKHIQKGNDLGHIGFLGNNYLHTAIEHDFTQLALLIFNTNSNLVISKNEIGETPLFIAFKKRNYNFITNIIKYDLNLENGNLDVKGSNILHLIFQFSHLFSNEEMYDFLNKYPNLLFCKDILDQYPFSYLFNPYSNKNELYNLLKKIIVKYPTVLDMDIELDLSMLILNSSHNEESNTLLEFIAKINHKVIFNQVKNLLGQDKLNILKIVHEKDNKIFDKEIDDLALKAAESKSENSLTFFLELYPELNLFRNEKNESLIDILERIKNNPPFFDW